MRLAHHLAVASEWIRGDCVEATEFPDLAQRYMVMAVPKTVVNDRVSFEGAVPEAQFVDAVLRAVGAPPRTVPRTSPEARDDLGAGAPALALGAVSCSSGAAASADGRPRRAPGRSPGSAARRSPRRRGLPPRSIRRPARTVDCGAAVPGAPRLDARFLHGAGGGSRRALKCRRLPARVGGAIVPR